MVHKWSPCHREPVKRSHVDKAIVLLKIDEKYVPIVETAVCYILDTPAMPSQSNLNQEEASKDKSIEESSGNPPAQGGGGGRPCAAHVISEDAEPDQQSATTSSSLPPLSDGVSEKAV